MLLPKRRRCIAKESAGTQGLRSALLALQSSKRYSSRNDKSGWDWWRRCIARQARLKLILPVLFFPVQERDRALDAARKARTREGARHSAGQILGRLRKALETLEATSDHTERMKPAETLRSAVSEVNSLPSTTKREFDRLDKHGVFARALEVLDEEGEHAAPF